ncbi:MAG: DUF5666 domain-containing protein, partial [Polaromonas sp.]
MKIANETPGFARVTRRGGLLTLLAGALALAGCGGGSDSNQAAVSSGGTGSVRSADAGGSLSVGPISGMGSIIVNGVRFDDKAAKILDDDGTVMKREDLKLGMMARVKGKAKSRKADDTGKENDKDEAEEITVGSDLLGPIESFENLATTDLKITPAKLTVLGQIVLITAATVIAEGTILASLAADQIVEVHGFVDPVTNQLTATRIERILDLAKVNAFKLQGKISNVTATSFMIGTRVITIDSAVELAKLVLADLINGLHVRVRLDKTTKKAKHIRKVDEDDEDDRDEAEVKGTITDFTPSGNFTVNGRKIDVSAVINLAALALKLGVHVEVKGRLVKGVLVAKTIKLENITNPLKFELHGKVTLTGVSDPNADTLTFTLTSTGGIVAKVTVSKADAVKFAAAAGLDSTALRAKLAAGVKVEVKGEASIDGTI